jgi:hypothetical protein
MPTVRQRHMITETIEIERAIKSAARAWPEIADERAELLRRLIEAGATSIEAQNSERIALKRKAIIQNAGGFSGMWPDNWREELRNEWPE